MQVMNVQNKQIKTSRRKVGLFVPLACPGMIHLERVMGIEPTQPAWKAGALPLSHTRKVTPKGGKQIGADEEI
jgi:hypothetical protein